MASTSTTSKKGRKSNGEKPPKPKKTELTDESEAESEYDPHATWDCTVCTYRNRYEAFKCEICDTRKGTSTRKPRLNSNVVQQQVLVQAMSQEKSHNCRRTRTSTHRALTPDSIEAGPSSVGNRRESSVGSNIPEIGSPSSTSSKDKDKDKEQEPKRDKIKDSLLLRDSAKKYEFVDSEDEKVGIVVAYKSRHADKELASLNMLKDLEVIESKHREKVDKARAEYDEERRVFNEEREKYRAERAARPKRVKKPRKIRVSKKLGKLKPGKNIVKTPVPRGRPKNKTPTTTRGGKTTTPGSSKKK